MKRLLLDTHAFLWWISGDDSLGVKSRAAIGDTENQVFVSAASVWEMSIKQQLGKLTVPSDMEAIVEQSGFEPLPIGLFHAQQAGSLVMHHRDPFDRMLIAQAQAEGLVLVTVDAAFPAYGVRLLDAGS